MAIVACVVFFLVWLAAWLTGAGDPGRGGERIWIVSLWSAFTLFLVTSFSIEEPYVDEDHFAVAYLSRWLSGKWLGRFWTLLRLAVLMLAGCLWLTWYADQFGRLDGHDGPVTAVRLPSESFTVTGSDDGTVRIWSLREWWGRPLPGPRQTPVGCVAISVTPGVIVAGGGGIETNPDTEKLEGVNCFIRVWDLPADNHRELGGHTRPVLSIAISPTDPQTLVSTAGDGVRAWDLATGKPKAGAPWDRHFGWAGHTDTVLALAFSPDGKRIASAGKDGTVRVREITDLTGRHTRVFEGHKGRAECVAYSPDGLKVASGGKDGTVRLWDVGTGGELGTFWGHTQPVKSVVFSPAGDRLVSGGDDASVRVWSVLTGQQLRRYAGHGGSVRSVAVSPDGKLAVAGDNSGRVRIWRLPP
jgi:WD40 repeat protein